MRVTSAPATATSRAGLSGRRATGWLTRCRHGWDGPRIAVLIAAALAAAITVVLSSTVFSHLSVNNDEAVYLLQAKTLAGGHLFPPTGTPPDSFTPWLAVVHGGHYVLKYVPVVALFLALSIVITGGYVTGLALLAAATVGSAFLLTKEVSADRRTAAIAACLLAASPVTMVQSALILPYVLFMLLAQLALWGLLAGTRKGSRSLMAIAGLCAAIGFAARPYDAVLLLGPVLLWWLWRGRRERRRTARRMGFMAAGAAVPIGALLWFNAQATGSPLRLPFSLFESGDTLGFGIHRVYPGEAPRHFGLAQGWEGLARHLSLLGGGWAFGGLLLALLAVVGLVRRRASPAAVAILAGGLLFLLGYLCFWGTWNAAIVWGATRYLGPYYLLPLLIPGCILAASGLVEVAAIGRVRAVAVVLASAAISGITFGRALEANAALGADNAQLAHAVAAQGRSLVFVNTYPDFLQHPTAVISNAVPVGGRTVYALARGAADFQVLKAYPGRPLYRLRLLGEYGKTAHHGFGAVLSRLRLVVGRTLRVRVIIAAPASTNPARLLVNGGTRTRSFAVPAGRTSAVTVTLSAADGSTGAATFTLLSGKTRLDRFALPLQQGGGGRVRAMVPSATVAQLGPLAPAPLTVQLAGR